MWGAFRFVPGPFPESRYDPTGSGRSKKQRKRSSSFRCPALRIHGLVVGRHPNGGDAGRPTRRTSRSTQPKSGAPAPPQGPTACAAPGVR